MLPTFIIFALDFNLIENKRNQKLDIMEGFKNLEIKNFRGIDHLSIDDFSRVNVFLGQNNSGKSSVLEAITLISGMSNPYLPAALNALRARKTESDFTDIRYFFHNLILTVPPEISTTQTDHTERKLIMEMPFEMKGKSTIEIGQMPRSDAMTQLDTLNMKFEVDDGNEKKQFVSSYTLGQPVNLAKDYQETIGVSLVSSDFTGNAIVGNLTQLFKQKMKSVILERLQIFDSRIIGIELFSNDVFINFEGIAELLPIAMAGDGLRRYLSIVAASANSVNSIIAIDEIDNGLHYSAYKKLWEAIFTLATTTNKQVFVTTHSKETLGYLNEMLEEHPGYQQEMRLYTIAKTLNKGHQAYKYTYEGLSGACENNIELRGMTQ